jgi:hypothetical protein
MNRIMTVGRAQTRRAGILPAGYGGFQPRI